MKILSAALVLASAAAASQAHAACPYPAAPGKFPDGSTASKDEMLAAKSEVVKYNADIEAYLVCIKSDFDARLADGASLPKDKKAEMQRKQDEMHNAAVNEVTEVTERFNEQLRAWKAKADAAKGK